LITVDNSIAPRHFMTKKRILEALKRRDSTILSIKKDKKTFFFVSKKYFQ